jgi:NhaC family Na+:H+ antiporter
MEGAGMSEKWTLLIFLLLLAFCLITGASVLYALAGGWLLFFLYGLKKGLTPKELFTLSMKGVKRIRSILFTFVLIGMITAVWRMAGTIPYITVQSAAFISPSGFVLVTFLLCSFVSFLMGTSLGTAATMGVICLSVANALGVSALHAGGAMLAGVYFGDRCSPMSTSALLVATLTETDIYTNIRLMLKTAFFPFLLSCVLFYLLGTGSGVQGAVPDIGALFGQAFTLNWIAFLPAAVILLLSLFRVKVQLSMAVSILLGVGIALFVQRVPLADIPRFLLTGFSAQDAQLNKLLGGGGILSMARTGAIVALSATYSGLFEGTGLLDRLKGGIEKIGAAATPFAGVLATSVFTALIGFNQTLPVMLTHQLCKDMVKDRQQLAIMMENSVIVIPPLIPWSIAGAVPLVSVGAPLASIPFAVFLYLLPLWRLGVSIAQKKKAPRVSAGA